MAEQPHREGQQFGKYRLERLLGRGGFAEVYLGYHLRLQRPAAIKLLHASLSEQDIVAFEREAQLIAALNHPNIVRVFDFDVQQGIPFLVMDYLPNGTLRQRHPKGQQVPLPTVISYVTQVADALQYAHDQRLIHRDVKPENILIGPRNEIVLSDFGIAAIAHGTSSRTAQESAGTIPYMAPEQIQARARPASDQYALGIVTYEWLSGERPFEGSYTEIFAKHLMTPPAPLRQKLPNLSPELELVILKSLAKDPKDRFGSIQAFAAALQAAGTAPQKRAEVTVKETVLPRSSQPQPPAAFPPLLTALPKPFIKQMSRNVHTPTTSSLPPTIAPAPLLRTSPQIHLLLPTFSRRRMMIVLATGGIIAAGGWWFLAPHPLYTYHGHSDGVLSVAWSPNGTRIASASYDKTVQVWDAENGGHVFTYRGHTSDVYAAAWSPKGTRIASAGRDNTVQVWDATNGGNKFIYRGHTDVINTVAWSPNGTHIASASYDGTVQVWNATVNGSNSFIYSGHSDVVNSVAWSPNGSHIASAGRDNTVQVCDATNGGKIFTYIGHVQEVTSVAWSPNSTRIASASRDNTVQVWDATNGGDKFIYHGHSDGIYAMAWAPNGIRIASASVDKIMQIWDAADGGNKFTTRNFRGPVAWSPNSQLIASGGDSYNIVQIWKAQ